jgi:hypothetical protein
VHLASPSCREDQLPERLFVKNAMHAVAARYASR